MNALEFNELPFLSKLRICWGFVWRGLCVTLGSTVCGALLGGVIGFVFAMLGFPKTVAPLIAAGFGLLIGLGFIYLYVRWILSTRLGQFRLKLVPAEPL